MNRLARWAASTRRDASLEPVVAGTVPTSLLSGLAAAVVVAACLPAALLDWAGGQPLAVFPALAAVAAAAALVLLWPQHVTALVVLLLMGAAYLRVGDAGQWALPLYVLASHAVYVVLALTAIGPRSARFTRAALREVASTAAAPQVTAQLLCAVVLLMPWWRPAAGSLGTAAGIASACVLAGGAFAASRVAGRPENPD